MILLETLGLIAAALLIGGTLGMMAVIYLVRPLLKWLDSL